MSERALARADRADRGDLTLAPGVALPPIRVDTAQIGLMDLAKALAGSGYFKDTKDAAQAVVKVLLGQEMGFPPVTSVMGIHIIEGKPSLSSHLIAAAIKRSGRYDFRVPVHTTERCEIVFYDRAEELGRNEWTMQDAVRAKLADKDVWKKYARQMLFARCLTEGARMHLAHLFGGVAFYVPEELGAEVDASGEVVRLPSGTVVATETGEVLAPRPQVAERVSQAAETSPSYAQSAGIAPDPNAAMARLREAWGRHFDAGDAAGLKDYTARVLGRKPVAAKSDPGGFCADMEMVTADLNRSEKSRKRCFATYSKLHGDPDAEGGEVMRSAVELVLDRAVPTRSTLTAEEMDRCVAAWEASVPPAPATHDDPFEE